MHAGVSFTKATGKECADGQTVCIVFLRGAAVRLYASLSPSPRARRAGLSPSRPGKQHRLALKPRTQRFIVHSHKNYNLNIETDKSED